MSAVMSGVALLIGSRTRKGPNNYTCATHIGFFIGLGSVVAYQRFGS